MLTEKEYESFVMLKEKIEKRAIEIALSIVEIDTSNFLVNRRYFSDTPEVLFDNYEDKNIVVVKFSHKRHYDEDRYIEIPKDYLFDANFDLKRYEQQKFRLAEIEQFEEMQKKVKKMKGTTEEKQKLKEEIRQFENLNPTKIFRVIGHV